MWWFYSNSGSYWVESCSVVSRMAEIIFPSAGRKYDAHISRGGSEKSLFTTQKIDLYASIYSNFFCHLAWAPNIHLSWPKVHLPWFFKRKSTTSPTGQVRGYFHLPEPNSLGKRATVNVMACIYVIKKQCRVKI